MTWLVTGATGLIGSALVEALAGSRPLRLLVRRKDGRSAEQRLSAVLPQAVLRSPGIEIVEGDMTLPSLGLDRKAAGRAGGDLQGVVHLAAQTCFEEDDPASFQRINVKGALAMARIALAARCPLHHVSTAYVSGNHTGLFREDDLELGQNHHNTYERSKWEAERQLRRMAARDGLRLRVFRPGLVLPDRPGRVAVAGPGPLLHLGLLAALQRRRQEPRSVRCAADPDALLNVVGLDWVVRVLAASLDQPWSHPITYHLTAAQALTTSEMAAAMGDSLQGVRPVVCPPETLSGLDAAERRLVRLGRPYQPYLFLRTVHDRHHLLADFDGDDGVDGTWLRVVFAAHLASWSRERSRRRARRTGPHPVADYFERFLAERRGILMVPGLRSLSAEFTVTVPSVGIFRLRIQNGVLESVERVTCSSPDIDFESDPESLLQVVTARAKPADLFFRRRVRIHGNLFRALSTATALEAFFRSCPYTPALDAGASA